MRSRKKSKDTLKKMKMRTQQSKICGILEIKSKREVHSRGLSQKKKEKNKEKAQINNLTSYLKEHEKEEQVIPNVNRRKEIIKIRVQINKIEAKMIQYINESKSWFFE